MHCLGKDPQVLMMVRANINEAANRLKVSVDTVRRRLKNGSLVGEQDERGRWWLHLEDPQPGAPTTGGDQTFTIGAATPLQPPGGISAELIAFLHAQIDDLRSRLDASEAERRTDKEKAAVERQELLSMIEKLV